MKTPTKSLYFGLALSIWVNTWWEKDSKSWLKKNRKKMRQRWKSMTLIKEFWMQMTLIRTMDQRSWQKKLKTWNSSTRYLHSGTKVTLKMICMEKLKLFSNVLNLEVSLYLSKMKLTILRFYCSVLIWELDGLSITSCLQEMIKTITID